MGIQVNISTDNLSELDYKILAVLGSAATAPKTESVSAPAKKAAAKPKPAPEKEMEEEEEEETDEDLVGGSAPTMKDAVAKATELVSAGNQAAVKAALTGVGVKRVSELKANQIADFLEALDD